MLRLFETFNFWTNPNAILFPSRVQPNSVLSHSSFRRHLKTLCSLAGLDSSLYSGHSLRAGGATDLFNAGVPYQFIKLFGRWQSDTALIYYRDRVEMVNATAAGFSKIAKSLLP